MFQASTTQINVTLSDLQDLATWQQQQINSQQHLLASKVLQRAFCTIISEENTGGPSTIL